MEINNKNLTTKSLQEKLKKTLLLSIMADIEKNPQKSLYWAEKFINKLMPNETTVSGDKENPLEVKIYDENQIKNIAKRIIGDGTNTGNGEAESKE